MSNHNIVLQDRIKELSHTAGGGPFTLDGKINGFSPFGDFYEYGDPVFYAATDGTYYEVGSGEYRKNGSNNELTRFPFRSSYLDNGPYYLLGTSNTGATAGQNGYFHPLYLTQSAAVSGGAGASTHTHTFDEFPGQTFHMPSNFTGHAEAAVHGGTSGVNYNASGVPFSWPNDGIKEVYVTYPGKYSVYTGFGISGYKEPLESGIAFWGDNQTINYDSNILWSKTNSRLAINQSNPPEYAIHVGGNLGESVIAASGFFTGGSGIYISGVASTYSGGRQREPFFRNKLDNTTGSDAVFFLAGVVDEQIKLSKQEKGTVFAGPPSGCSPTSCSPDYPTFRYLTSGDMPDLSSLYIIQDKDMGISTDNIPAGAIALYKESGVITYDTDHKLVFNRTTNRLGVNTASPRATLDVFGDMKVSGAVEISGNLNVRGDVTYVDSSNVAIYDKQIELASLSGNALHEQADHLVDDGGMVVKSSGDGVRDTGDKKWTWKESTNAWTAQTSNSELLGINTSGLIFPDSSAISGAYHMGSGMTLHNGIELNIGHLFYASGTDNNVRHIHQGQNLVVSGISGIQTKIENFGANDVLLTIDPSGLSGVFQHAIDNSVGYNWKILTENITSADTIASADTVTISGVSGVDVYYNSATNLIEIDPSGLSGWITGRIGQLAGGYNYWTIKNELGSSTQTENISSTHALTVSGVSGINTFYDVGNNRLTIAPIELSGVLMSKIAGATNYNYWTIESKDGLKTISENISSTNKLTVSGLSGVMAWYGTHDNTLRIAAAELSGVLQAGINDANTSTAGSGLTKVGSALHMDIGGSGQLRHLMFYRGPEAGEEIRIGQNASGVPSGVVIGDKAAQSQWESIRTIAIGTDAARNIQSGVDSTAIGQYAASQSSGVIFSNLIGYRAGFSSSGDRINVIGSYAGESSSGNVNTNMFGFSAGFGSWEGTNTNIIGTSAARDSERLISSDVIGLGAGAQASGWTNTVAIGSYAASGASGLPGANIIGYKAGLRAIWADYANLMGYNAGQNIEHCHYLDAIGYNAAKDATNASATIFIGKNAGIGSQGLHLVTANYNVGVGHRSLHYASGNYSITAIGRRAADAASGCEYSNFIGHSAGLMSSGIQDSNFMGRGAGEQAHITKYVDALGHAAAKNILKATGVTAIGTQSVMNGSGVIYTTAVGYGAAEAASGVTKMVAIGYKAATESYDSDYSILVGNYAGYEERRKYSVILNPRPLVSAGNFAGPGTDGVLDVMDLIHGIHYDADDVGSSNKVVSIGKTPSDASAMANVTLGVRPPSVNHIGIKTYRAFSNPAAAQIASSTDQAGSSNTIVNEDGWLQLPWAKAYVGGLVDQLYTHETSTTATYTINKHDGACALYIKGGVVQLAAYGNGSWNFTTMNDTPTP